MIVDEVNKIKAGSLKKKYSLSEIYSEFSYETRLEMKRVSEYADILIEYMWSNRIFPNILMPDLVKYRDQIFLYVNDQMNKNDLKNLYFEKMSDDEIEYIIDILDYKNEKWDGTGSPYNKKGEGIPFAARVYALAKRYAELVYENPYKIQDGNALIINQIEEESGTSFQPEMVTALKNCFALLQKKDIELGVVIE